MAVATYTSDLTDIFLFETTTGVTAFGGGASGLGASPDYSIEGTNAVDKQVSASEKGFLYDNVSNFTIGPSDHFMIWVVCAVPGLVATRNNRGIAVCIGDDTSNYVQFHVNGGDTKPRGGIQPYAVRYTNSTLTNRRTLVGTPSATPSQIGGSANVTGTAKFSNFACDAARIGTGYDITGGDGPDADATFAGIAANDETTSEGLFQTADGGYSVQGKMRIGNSGTPCVLTDSNTNILIIDGLDGIVQSDFTEFLVSDDASVLTLTNVNFIALGTNNPGRLENLTPLVHNQDETSYDNSPSTEGTFSGGTGHAVSDVITMSDGWTRVTVDAVSGGVVTQFTVNSLRGRSATAGTVLTQSSTTGSGTGFSLTPDTDNVVGAGTITCENVGFVGFGETVLSANDDLSNGRWIGCDRIFANGAVLNNNAFTGYEGTANTSYLVWDVNSDPDGELDGCSFAKGTAATHAIEFGENSPTTMTLRDIDFSGYNATDGQNDSTFHFKRNTGSVTLNLVGVTGNVSYRTEGATITIVQNPVTLTINVSDVADDSAIAGARVYVVAGATGPLPYQEPATITRSGSTATLDIAPISHTLSVGQKILVSGANQDEYNGIKTVVTVPSATSVTYTVSGTPTTPATGTIIATAVILSTTTNGSGVASDTRTYSSNQSFTGRVRDSSSSPYYKTSPISGTISSTNGLTVNVPMILDE